MIAARFTSVNALGVTIRPPFAERAKAVIARSISLASRKPIGRNSTPNDGATDWIAPNWPAPAAILGSRMTPTLVTRGAICLSSSNHFPLKPYSKAVKPVALVPGRARLSTKPPPTGSTVVTNTIGTERVARCNGPTVALPVADHIRRERHQFDGVSANTVGIAPRPA